MSDLVYFNLRYFPWELLSLEIGEILEEDGEFYLQITRQKESEIFQKFAWVNLASIPEAHQYKIEENNITEYEGESIATVKKEVLATIFRYSSARG